MNRKIFIGPRPNKWFDKQCILARKDTRKWWRLFKRAQSVQNKSVYRLRYVERRKSYRSIIKAKRQLYNHNKVVALAEKVGNSKLFWSEVRSICQSSVKMPNIDKDEWFHHFKNVFNTTQPVNLSVEDEQVSVAAPVYELDRPITSEEVCQSFKTLNITKSPGPDGILAGMLKHSADCILPYVVELFNCIFSSGVYPLAWSGAVIVPIHKSGNPDIPDNYREISLLSILSKSFSHILNKRITTWSDQNNLIDESQGGFRAGYSIIIIIIRILWIFYH